MLAIAEVFFTGGSFVEEALITGSKAAFSNPAVLEGVRSGKDVSLEASYLMGGSYLIRASFAIPLGRTLMGFGLRWWSPGSIMLLDEQGREAGSLLPYRLLLSAAFSPPVKIGVLSGGAAIDVELASTDSFSFGGALRGGVAVKDFSVFELGSAYVSLGYDPYAGLDVQFTTMGDFLIYSKGTTSIDGGASAGYRGGPVAGLFITYREKLTLGKGMPASVDLRLFYEPSINTIYISPASGMGLSAGFSVFSGRFDFALKYQGTFIFYTFGLSYSL